MMKEEMLAALGLPDRPDPYTDESELWDLIKQTRNALLDSGIPRHQIASVLDGALEHFQR